MLEEFDKRLKKAKLYGEDLCVDVDDIDEDDDIDADGFDDVDEFDCLDVFDGVDGVDEDNADEAGSEFIREKDAKIAELERRLKKSKKDDEDVFDDIDESDVDDGAIVEGDVVEDELDEDGVDGHDLPEDDLDEIQNPLLEYRLPAINPFLVVAKMESNKSAKMSYEDIEKAVGKSMQEILAQTPSSTLKLAGDNGYFDINSEKARERTALRRITGSLFMRYHLLTDHQIAELIVPARFQDDIVGRHWCRNQVKQWQTNFQSSIMKIYVQSLKLTVEKTGGANLWKSATVKQRAEMFKKMWASDKKMMAKAALGIAARYVPIDDIFEGDSATHKLWQRAHEAVFVWVCEKVFEHRIAGKTDNKKSVFEFWRGMMYAPQFGKGGVLELGSSKDIPVTVR